MTEDEERFLCKLEKLYIAARDVMDGTTSPIRRLIDEGDVVYSVWPDAIKPHGIDYGVLKGGELLEKESGRVVVLLRETRGAVPEPGSSTSHSGSVLQP